MKQNTCAFAGHRPQKLPFGFDEEDIQCLHLKLALAFQMKRLIYSGVTDFISGMALGTDLFCAELVCELRREYPSIRLIAAIPYQGQAHRWDQQQRKRYSTLLAAADEVHILAEHYTKDCMRQRNKWMLERAGYLIAVYGGEDGGTKQALAWARRNGLAVTMIDPADSRVIREASAVRK